MKTARRNISPTAELLSLLLALALVLVIAVLAWREWVAFGRSSEQLAGTREVAERTAELLSALKDAETGQRGYLLTGREGYLEPWLKAVADVPEALNRLSRAAAPHTDQARRVEALRPLLAEKLGELSRTIDLRRSAGPDAAVAVVVGDRGRAVMDEIRRRCAEIQSAAYGRLVLQSEDARSSANEMGFVSTAGALALFALLILSTITIRNGAERRLKLIEELRRSDRRAREARDWLQTTTASIGDAVVATDGEGNVTFLNPVARSLTGWTQEEAAGKPLDRIFVIRNEETGAAVESPASKALREGTVVGLANHTILTAKDGRRIPIDDSAAPIRGADGTIAGVVLVFRDITDRKRSEETLRRTVEFDEAVMRNMGEGLYTVDSQGLVTFMNPAAEKYFGWSFEQLRGRKMHDMTHHHHPDGTPFPAEECSGFQVLKHGRNLMDHEDIFIRRDGTFFDVVYSSSPLRSGGEILGLVVVFRDVSERKRLEKELRSNERIYRAIGESIEYGVWVCTPDGRNRYASDSFLKLVGLTQDQCSDFGWGSVLHPDDSERTIAAWKERVRSGGAWSIDHRFRGVDGQFHWILARGVAVRDEAGEVVCWAGINLDIDQLKAVEESLRSSERELRATNQALMRANEDLNQFAFAASHDLQEPLRMIAVYSQLLIKGCQNPIEGEAALCVNFITDGTRRMREMLSDLLAYTQVNVEEGDGEEQTVDLNLVVQQAIENCRAAIEESAGSVVAERLPFTSGYGPHFIQLFQNLIGNAIKYRGESAARIHVSVEKADGIWRVAVADNGIGIAPEYHRKIFGVFKRLHGREIPGTGIGLAICQRVVDRYGGRIWVESRLNEGATFFFTLPLTKGTAE